MNSFNPIRFCEPAFVCMTTALIDIGKKLANNVKKRNKFYIISYNN